MQGDTIAGVAFIAFGIIIGGVGVASAGIGMAIPIIPIGIYLVWRGISRKSDPTLNNDSLAFEKSGKGKIGIGILLILTGIATSAWLIGIPILGFGGYLAYKGYMQIRASSHYQIDT